MPGTEIFTMDPITDHLIPDPCDPPTPCTVLEGYLGRGCCSCCACEEAPEPPKAGKAAKGPAHITAKGSQGIGCKCATQPPSYRLYFDRSFDQWIEVRHGDLLTVSSVDGRSVVRVKRDAVLLFTQVLTADCCGQGFLSGPIASGGERTSDAQPVRNPLPLPPSVPPKKPGQC